MKKWLPAVSKDLERLYARTGSRSSKYGPLSDEEIDNVVRESRRKRQKQGKL
ncbi:MAG: hypothetical protein ACREBU_07005 [Nitrososphaera sp.]